MKKTITAISLAIVMMFGATLANAGIIVGDRATSSCDSAAAKDGIIVFGAKDGIIVFGLADAGIIVFGKDGIIVFGAKETTPCTSATKSGIIVGD
ncbi:hypothetical protein BH10ACI2_BH10ACI2_11420 [soil metagenome]